MAGHRLGALGAVTLICLAPAVAQTGAGTGSQTGARRAAGPLSLVMEAGVRQRDGATIERLREMQARLLALLDESGAPLAETVQALGTSILAAESLPVTMRLYLPSTWQGKTQAPPAYVAVIDAKGKLALGPAAAPGGGSRRVFVEELALAGGGHRYLVGAGREALGDGLAALARDPAPAVSAAVRQVWSRVDRSPVYACFDLTPTIRPNDLKELLAMAGPASPFVAIGLTLESGDWNLDLHLGVQAGQGRIGALLPRSVESTRLNQLLPWQPGLAMQGNLGAGFGSRIMPFLEQTQAPLPGILAMLLSSGRDDWTGEFGIYQPAGKPGKEPPSDFVFLLRSSDEGAAALVDTMRGNIKRGLVEGDEENTWRLDAARGQSLTFGHRAGVVAVCGGGDARTATRTLGRILAAAAEPPAKTAAGNELPGMLQVWMSKEAFAAAGQRLEERRAKALGRWLPKQQAQALVEALRELRGDVRFAVTCDAPGVRLRCRF
jgi:hypothetical protein